MRKHAILALGIILMLLFSACTPHTSQKVDWQELLLQIPRECNAPTRTKKTTKENCEAGGGHSYHAHVNALPQDMVDCVYPLPDDIAIRCPSRAVSPPILVSVYDYLYRAGTEKPEYGLYSYVLFPVHSTRAERFLEELFKTTSFAEIGGAGLWFGNLNLIYLPTRADKVSSLIPFISDGSAPPVQSFAVHHYDYALAEKLLAQICKSPTKVIRDVCRTDLSRGPYLFTFGRPASVLFPVPPPYLFVDLSRVHEGAFGEFIAAYKEQVKRTDYSDLERIDNLRLQLLSVILVAADWIGPIKGAIADTIHMAKEEGAGK